MGLSKIEFNKIRDSTKQAWVAEYEDSHPGRSSRFSTSYTAAYHTKDWNKKQNTRPTSPTRLNNPHPQRKFLSTKVRAPRECSSTLHNKTDDINLTIEPLGNVKPLVHQHIKPFGSMRYVYELEPPKYGQSEDLVLSDPIESTPICIQRSFNYTEREVHGMKVREHSQRPTSLPSKRSYMNEMALPVLQHNIAMREKHNSLAYPGKPLHKQIYEQRKSAQPQASLHRWKRPVGIDEIQFAEQVHKSSSFDKYSTSEIDRKLTGQLDVDRYLLGKYASEEENRKKKFKIHPRLLRTEYRTHPEWIP